MSTTIAQPVVNLDSIRDDFKKAEEGNGLYLAQEQRSVAKFDAEINEALENLRKKGVDLSLNTVKLPVLGTFLKTSYPLKKALAGNRELFEDVSRIGFAIARKVHHLIKVFSNMGLKDPKFESTVDGQIYNVDFATAYGNLNLETKYPYANADAGTLGLSSLPQQSGYKNAGLIDNIKVSTQYCSNVGYPADPDFTSINWRSFNNRIPASHYGWVTLSSPEEASIKTHVYGYDEDDRQCAGKFDAPYNQDGISFDLGRVHINNTPEQCYEVRAHIKEEKSGSTSVNHSYEDKHFTHLDGKASDRSNMFAMYLARQSIQPHQAHYAGIAYNNGQPENEGSRFRSDRLKLPDKALVS